MSILSHLSSEAGIYLIGTLLILAGASLLLISTKNSFSPSSKKTTSNDAEKQMETLNNEAKIVIGLIDEFRDNVNGYSHRLMATNDNVRDAASPSEMRTIIEFLLNENRNLIASNYNLEKGLQEARQRIESLTSDLGVAQEESQRDALTNLYGRRHFDCLLPQKISCVQDARQSLCLLLIDIDNFKCINDTYGHPAGDEVLSKIGSLIQGSIRRDDIAARVGGDEFAIITPGATIAVANTIAERMRSLLEIKKWCFDNKQLTGAITISVGISTLRSGDSAKSLYARADANLYQAKLLGRNCSASR